MYSYCYCPPWCPYRAFPPFPVSCDNSLIISEYNDDLFRVPIITECEDGMIYTVGPGDSMYSISERFDIDLDELIEANPHIADPTIIFPGMRICIPYNNNDNYNNNYNNNHNYENNYDNIITNHQYKPTCSEGYIYIVQVGDTLSMLANRFDLTITDILQVNPQIIDPNILVVAQKICIPLPIPEVPDCQNGERYMIKKGETLKSIADKFKIRLRKLLQANPQIEDSEIIFPGQLICIPT